MVTYSHVLNAATTPWIFLEFVYSYVLNAATTPCIYASQLYWSCPLSTYLVFHREGNKGKQIQRTTNCYIPNQTLANKVANININEITNQKQETSQEMSINSHKHAKKPSLPYPNTVLSISKLVSSNSSDSSHKIIVTLLYVWLNLVLNYFSI